MRSQKARTGGGAGAGDMPEQKGEWLEGRRESLLGWGGAAPPEGRSLQGAWSAAAKSCLVP